MAGQGSNKSFLLAPQSTAQGVYPHGFKVAAAPPPSQPTPVQRKAAGHGGCGEGPLRLFL